MLGSFPNEGFLGTGAPFTADLNLVVQAAMGAALLAGALLARGKRYRAHGICQTSVLGLNLMMIATVMWPATREQVLPAFPSPFDRWYFAMPTLHGALGIVAQLMGMYIAAVAGTKLLPERLRFRNWKLWMRVELMLWWVTLLAGVSTYYVWYVAPQR